MIICNVVVSSLVYILPVSTKSVFNNYFSVIYLFLLKVAVICYHLVDQFIVSLHQDLHV